MAEAPPPLPSGEAEEKPVTDLVPLKGKGKKKKKKEEEEEEPSEEIESRPLIADPDLVGKLISKLPVTPGSSVTVNFVQNNNNARTTTKSTSTTTTNSNNNTSSTTTTNVAAEEEAKFRRAVVGQDAGYCFYEKCPEKDVAIRHDFSGEGLGSSYWCCSIKCCDVIVHDECLYHWTLANGYKGLDLRKECEKCGKALLIETDKAILRALGRLIMDWPFWLATRAWPFLILLGVLCKFFWFASVVSGLKPTDYFVNPALIEYGANDTVKFISPSWGNGDFMQYNFCLHTDISSPIMCHSMGLACPGYYGCSWGGLTFIEFWEPGWYLFYLLYMPVGAIWPDSGSFHIGMWPGVLGYMTYWIWFKKRFIQRLVFWITANYQRPKIRVMKVGPGRPQSGRVGGKPRRK
jgi:hypothetical protein